MRRLTILPRSRYIIYLALTIAAAGAMWGTSRCGGGGDSRFGDTAPAPSGGDTIDVAIEYAPLSFYRQGDTIGGFNYEMLTALARRGNLTIKYHPVTDLANPLDGLNDGTYDIVVSDIPVTSSIKEEYHCTPDVYLDRQVLVQLRDSVKGVAIRTQLDLAGSDVWVVNGSPATDRLRNLQREIGDTIVLHTVEGYGSEQLFMMVAAGEIPRCVINESMARALATRCPDIDISTGISFTRFQTWVMAKNNRQLASRIDSLITDFKSTEAYSELIRQYFP